MDFTDRMCVASQHRCKDQSTRSSVKGPVLHGHFGGAPPRKRVQAEAFDESGGGFGSSGPETPDGSFFPALLERRRRVDGASYAVAREVRVRGVSTADVDDRVRYLADVDISKPEVSRVCRKLDQVAQEFRAWDSSDPSSARPPYRGLPGVPLRICDAHKGLKTAIQITWQGSTW